MPNFIVHVSWVESGYANIQADSPEEASEKARKMGASDFHTDVTEFQVDQVEST